MDSNEIEDFKNREKREVERFHGSIVEYSFDKDNLVKKTAFIKDISIKGVCIIVNKQIELATTLYLSICLPGINPPIDVVGQVIWQNTSTEFADDPSNYFDIGVAFIELNDYNLGRLMRILHITKPYKS